MDTFFQILRIFLFVVPVVMALVASIFCDLEKKSWKVLISVSAFLGVAFIIVLCLSNWNYYAIAKIIALILLCVSIITWGFTYEPVLQVLAIVLVIPVLFLGSFIFKSFQLGENIKEVEEPKISISSQELLCANDGTITTGNLSGGGGFLVFSVIGSSEEESVYKYYYLLPDGGAKLGQVKADDTTIYYIDSGEKPHLDKITTTYYSLDYNESPPKECRHNSIVTYKLYVPKNSISSVYEFDAA